MRPRALVHGVVVTVLAMTLGASPAHALDSFTYLAHEPCPERAEVLRAWTSELDRRRAAERPSVTLSVSHSDDGNEFVGRGAVTTRRGTRQRTLRGRSCRDVVNGLLLILAMGGDGAGVEQEAPEPVPPALAAPRPGRPLDTSTIVAPPASPSLRWWGSASAGVALGLTPHPASIGQLNLSASYNRMAIGAYGGAVIPNYASPADRPENAWFSGFYAGGRGCYSFGSAIEVAPCAGAEAILLSGTGAHATQVFQRRASTVAPAISGRAAAFVGRRVAISLEVLAAVPVARPPFSIANEFIHRESKVVGRALLGVELLLQ